MDNAKGLKQSPSSAVAKSTTVPTSPSIKQNSPAAEMELGSTLEAFNSRMRQRKLERQTRDGESEKAAKLRHSLMLEAMTTIRRSLQDVSRIDLGDRFSFSLETDDWGGWPRLQLFLSDALVPQGDYPIFQVTANDRHLQGCLEIAYGVPNQIERVGIQNREQLKHVAQVLKRCVRIYLDLVEKTVCEAELNEVEELERKSLAELEDVDAQEAADDRLTGDLFEEDDFQQDFLEKLPEIGELDSLPDFNSETRHTLSAGGKAPE